MPCHTKRRRQCVLPFVDHSTHTHNIRMQSLLTHAQHTHAQYTQLQHMYVHTHTNTFHTPSQYTFLTSLLLHAVSWVEEFHQLTAYNVADPRHTHDTNTPYMQPRHLQWVTLRDFSLGKCQRTSNHYLLRAVHVRSKTRDRGCAPIPPCTIIIVHIYWGPDPILCETGSGHARLPIHVHNIIHI